jgi:hypothetical protein
MNLCDICKEIQMSSILDPVFGISGFVLGKNIINMC